MTSPHGSTIPGGRRMRGGRRMGGVNCVWCVRGVWCLAGRGSCQASGMPDFAAQISKARPGLPVEAWGTPRLGLIWAGALHRWAEPEVDHLSLTMRSLVQNPGAAQAKGVAARHRVVER